MAQEKKTFTIYVEGTPHTWLKDEITYAEVVSPSSSRTSPIAKHER